MYKLNIFTQIILVLSSISGILSQCNCIDKAGEAVCILEELYSQTNQKPTVRINSSHDLLPNALPLNNIQSLKLNCNIQLLYFDSLANQESLTNLDLSQNSLSNIPDNFFTSMPLLQSLYLSQNQLKNPTLDTFQDLKKLEILDLSYNEISRIQLGILDSMKNLNKLQLNHNQISTIDLGSFDVLNDLLTVDLSYNKISKIEKNLFEYTKGLMELNLAGNYFNEGISLDALVGLTILNLSDSKIEILPIGMFNTMKKLMRLDLSKNKIFQIPSGLFQYVKNLKALNLASCNLTELPGNLFEHNLILEELDLSCNQLTTLPVDLFKTEEFKYLNLSHNSIVTLPIQIFQSTNLTMIDISYNEFTNIEPDLLNMETLEQVHAQNNKIFYLDWLTFASGRFPVKYINLRNNRLVFLEEVFFDWLANLERMEIFGNPWDCQCLEDLIKIMGERFIEYDSANYFDGKLPVCVSKSLDACNYNETDFNSYYEKYQINS